MKAIDLYIATEKNEKVPDIVFYDFRKYRYYPNENNYYREENCDLISLFLDAKPEDIIYLEEDTLKEDKKIEKLDLSDWWEITSSEDCKPEMLANIFNKNAKAFSSKLNEIIDKINGE